MLCVRHWKQFRRILQDSLLLITFLKNICICIYNKLKYILRRQTGRATPGLPYSVEEIYGLRNASDQQKYKSYKRIYNEMYGKSKLADIYKTNGVVTRIVSVMPEEIRRLL